jgi:type IV pilus assembly protein PilC
VARYSFTARNVAGQSTRGEIEAASEADARTRIKAQGFDVQTITRTGAGARVQVKNASFFSPRVNGRELQIFTRQFATLINAGIPVVDALKILSEGLRPGVLKEASAHIKTQIESGRRLAESMAQRPAVFDKLYCNMVQAGEEAGILDTILNRLAIYQEKSEKIKGQVKGALIYPSVIIFVSLVVISGILIFIIPKFQEFYSSSGKEPPALTMMVVGLSDLLVKNWYMVIATLVGGPIVFRQWISTESGRNSFDRFMMSAPIFGDVIQKSSVARVSRTLSTLLSSGVGVLEAIDISARTAGNIVIEDALLRSKESVSAGRPFAAPLAREKVFPDMVVQMIGIGEQSGTMDTMLAKIADFYEDEVETAVKAMTSIIEPVLMVVLGGIIAFIVIAMYLPIFNMADTIGG